MIAREQLPSLENDSLFSIEVGRPHIIAFRVGPYVYWLFVIKFIKHVYIIKGVREVTDISDKTVLHQNKKNVDL